MGSLNLSLTQNVEMLLDLQTVVGMDARWLLGGLSCTDCDCSHIERKLDKGPFMIKHVLLKQCGRSEG